MLLKCVQSYNMFTSAALIKSNHAIHNYKQLFNYKLCCQNLNKFKEENIEIFITLAPLI